MNSTQIKGPRLQAAAQVAYYIQIRKVICPKCGSEMYSPEEDWWLCGSSKCDFDCWTDDLKLVFPSKSNFSEGWKPKTTTADAEKARKQAKEFQ